MRRFLAVGLALPLLWAACARKSAPAASAGSDVKRSAREWLREEPVRLLADYVRIDTSLGHTEKEGAAFLQRFFDCEGIAAETVCPAPGRCNVLARLPGKRRDGALLLLNHIDVIDAFPQFWREAKPFEAEIKLGFLYGRGAYDMKSLGLAQALALARLKRRGIVPETDILFLAEADEEAGGRWGTRWLLANRPEWFAGVARGPQRRRHDRGHPPRGRVLGNRDSAGRLRPARIRGGHRRSLWRGSPPATRRFRSFRPCRTPRSSPASTCSPIAWRRP